MPLRLPAISITARSQQRRLFQSSAVSRGASQNHYETLQIPTDATPAEVKKSFYALSKAHHPDRNPDDPDASSRFVKISEAYAILGTPAKRHAYDRDFLRAQHSSSHHPHPQSHRSGSYHSTSSAGGRPASGLSRRRTQFRGPPPSFYRSGGWGEHGAKRAAAQENGAPASERPVSGEGTGGMGPGQMGWGHGNDVPHFDKEGHFRTHEQIENEKRKHRRVKPEHVPIGEGKGMFAQFLFISGIISLGVLVPSLIFERMTQSSKEGKR